MITYNCNNINFFLLQKIYYWSRGLVGDPETCPFPNLMNYSHFWTVALSVKNKKNAVKLQKVIFQKSH